MHARQPSVSTAAASQQGSGTTAPAIRQACVVGGGIAGLACAIAAAARGLRVDLFDQAPQPASVPAFVAIVPNMLRDLVRLGIADDCVRAGFAYSGFDVMDRQGRLQQELATPRLAGLRYPAALGIEYDELLRILDRAAQAHGVRLHRASEVTGQALRGKSAVLHLASGEEVSSELVVLATGAVSPLRTALFPHAAGIRDTGNVSQLWWYALVPRPLALQRPALHMGGVGRKVMVVPVRGDLAGLALMDPIQAADEVSTVSPGAHLRKALLEFPPDVQALARQLRDDTPVARRPVYSALLPEPWHREQVIAVGGAARAMPPHFGQAAAQAIEDATVLSELLVSTRDGHELAQRFTARRFPRARQVHEIVSTAARWDLEPNSNTDLQELSERLSRLVAEPA